ncbi:uncharacterized protein An04g05250 [Aspergillus niger]|uniref:Alkyl transferase n=2 Tax=Aspergillus niger TaxID=5061 RepID=A2QIZ3_ASPNC|nr:uncharacterized protein An04g05250 [Aspergillus niger]CAK38787.1 unnamed protein product [Aspergillus niger]
MSTSIHLSRFRKWLLASPPIEFAIGQLRDLLVGAIRQGPVPQHIAFVMDGNRRFARTHGIETVEGHNMGFEALARILEVCYKSGVKVVTIYAFSIENFKRSKFEVDALMEMARVKLSQMAQHGEILDRYGAKVRILGRLDLLRPDVLAAVNRAVEMTSNNGDCVLNICFPYTSRDEITTAVRDTVADLVFMSPETITRQTLSEHLFTHDNPPLDLLVRTSGVERLSDFMLWQCHEDTEIVFLDVLWPDFDLWQFLPVMLRWQRRISKSKKNPDAEGNFDGETSDSAEETNGKVKDL